MVWLGGRVVRVLDLRLNATLDELFTPVCFCCQTVLSWEDNCRSSITLVVHHRLIRLSAYDREMSIPCIVCAPLGSAHFTEFNTIPVGIQQTPITTLCFG